MRMWMEIDGLLKLHEEPGWSWMVLVMKVLEMEGLKEVLGLGYSSVEKVHAIHKVLGSISNTNPSKKTIQ